MSHEPDGATTGSAGSAAVSPLGAAVARVWGQGGRPVGGAFLAAPEHLLTCAHVVNMALGSDGGSSRHPRGTLTVDFPLVAPGVRVTARVDHWVPPGESAPEDIAGLRLVDPPPSAATPAALVDARETFDLRGVVLGFPELSDSGVWSIGRLRGRQARGWVQIDVDSSSQFDIRKGFSGVPVWDPGRAAAVGMIVTAWRGSGVRSAYMVPTAGLFEAWPQLRTMAQPPSPFPGLRAFSEAESDVFFGRDGLSAQIARRSRAAPVVTVIGPSGVGKSSLVRAGVLPRLRAEPGTLVVPMRPSEARTPLRSLAFALDRALAPERTRAEPDAARSDAVRRLDRVTELADRIVRDGMREVTGAVLEARGAERLLIFVDQLEEIFAASDQDADGFATALRSVVAGSGGETGRDSGAAPWPGSPVRLLCALRADFLGSALKRPLLGFLVDGERLVTVGELDDAELRRSIVGPVGKLRTMRYEEGLVNRIMDEVGHAPGRLPLVQFTLSRMWEHQRNGLLTHEAYEALGGVQNALADHAEHMWSGLDSSEQTRAARLLTQLVHPLPDRVAFTRRSAARGEFGDDIWALAGRLATSRVVVVRELVDAPRFTAEDEDPDGADDQQTRLGVELAHDSLITRWERLHQLALRDRDFRIWQDGLRRRIDTWYGEGCPKRRLLSLSDAREARRWLRTHPDEIGSQERRYLARSRRRHRGLGLRAAAVVTALAVAGTLVWRDQQEKLTTSAAHSLAEGASKLTSRDAYGEAQLALRAHRTAATKEAGAKVRNSYAGLQSADLVLPDPATAVSGTGVVRGGGVTSVRNQLSADGRTIALTAPDLKPAVWRVAENGRTVERVALRLLDPVMQGNRPAVDASGRYAAFITPMAPAITAEFKDNPCRPRDPTAIELTTCLTVFDTGSGRATVVVPVKGVARMASVDDMSIDPSGKVIGLVLKTANDTWELQRRELATGRLLSETPLHWDSYMGLRSVTGFWLAPGGESALVMTTGDGGKDPYTRHELRRIRLTGANGSVEDTVLARYAVDGAVAVSGDGTRIAAILSPSASEWGTEIKVWDVGTGEVVAQRPGLSDTLGNARITLDRSGKRLYATTLLDLGTEYPEIIPTFGPGATDGLEKEMDELEDASTARVWVWSVGGQEQPRQSAMRVSSSWTSVRSLGDGPDAPLALFARGAIGIVGRQGETLPEQRIAHRPADLTSINTGQAVARLCSALATPVESGSVRDLTPQGAATGNPCA
ncbi:AAA family ATPase [Streptomyces sp. NPDC002209]|uniref:nSTAND1 domain-containing NTPase n=1 Tax=Streptomyces sp. NPDC002209 TaxID=3364638 RepID=UPI00368B2ADE